MKEDTKHLDGIAGHSPQDLRELDTPLKQAAELDALMPVCPLQALFEDANSTDGPIWYPEDEPPTKSRPRNLARAVIANGCTTSQAFAI